MGATGPTGPIGPTGPSASGNTLEEAYDQGGPGAGRTITADSGPVHVDGPDGLHIASAGGVEVDYGIGIGTSAPDSGLVVSGGSVGIGAAPPTGDTKLTAAGIIESSSGGIKFPDGTVEDAAPGVASDVIYSYGVDLDRSWTLLVGQTITVPVAGHIMAVASCHVRVYHSNGTQTGAEFGVSMSPSAPPNSQGIHLGLPSAAATGAYDFPVSSTAMFPVSGGTKNVYFMGFEHRGNVIVQDRQLSLVFIPTAYGTVISP
jgi:hypothetical protein